LFFEAYVEVFSFQSVFSVRSVIVSFCKVCAAAGQDSRPGLSFAGVHMSLLDWEGHGPPRASFGLLVFAGGLRVLLCSWRVSFYWPFLSSQRSFPSRPDSYRCESPTMTPYNFLDSVLFPSQLGPFSILSILGSPP